MNSLLSEAQFFKVLADELCLTLDADDPCDHVLDSITLFELGLVLEELGLKVQQRGAWWTMSLRQLYRDYSVDVAVP
jgi:hypothetical protein